MDETLPVPADLHRERDEVIRYALYGGEAPKGLSAIQRWFSEDQIVWENLHSEAAAMHYEPAITPNHGELYRAYDSELRDHLGLGDGDHLDDAMRIAFVRDLLDEDWGNMDSMMFVGIGQRWLENEKGEKCLIGFTEELEGQSGIVCYWQGAFANETEWHNYLENAGYIRAYNPNDLPDETLLSLYQRDA